MQTHSAVIWHKIISVIPVSGELEKMRKVSVVRYGCPVYFVPEHSSFVAEESCILRDIS